jgi:hypothetical protein
VAGAAKRVLAWAALAAATGIALGYGIGTYRLAHLDCPRQATCEWSGFIPIVYAFWGFWGGLVLGLIGCLIYLENKERGKDEPDEAT